MVAAVAVEYVYRFDCVEIVLLRVSANGSYWENGKWIETKPLEIKRVYNFDGVGDKDMYLLHHEEIESLAKNIKGVKRIRFFMTFGQSEHCANHCGNARGIGNGLRADLFIALLMVADIVSSQQPRLSSRASK